MIAMAKAKGGRVRRGKKRSLRAAVSRAVREYAAASTLHGVGYVFERGQPVPSRLVWAAVVAVSLAFAVALSMQGERNATN